MRNLSIYALFVLLVTLSCSKSEEILLSKEHTIELEVVGESESESRALLMSNYDDIIAQGEFALSANLVGGGHYLNNAWVYHFVSDSGVARWRFRDMVNQDNLVDFYWPNDDNMNFMAYMPRNLATCVTTVTNLVYSASGVQFNATTPTVINDRTVAEREAENAKSEFVYAARLNQSKEAGTVKLRFVHPFAAIRFRLHQSHRDLVINSITLHGVDNAATYTSSADTYAPYGGGDMGQTYLTYNNWVASGSADLTINLDKRVPDDVNYSSQIGGPYVVIPQLLSDGGKSVKLSVNYSWNGATVQSAQFAISSVHVPAWQPGNLYTYTLDLGDNKEEILFKVVVEPWSPGEDEGYENSFDVE